MNRPSQAGAMGGSGTCAVCERPLSIVDARRTPTGEPPVCASRECHWAITQRARLGEPGFGNFLRLHRAKLAQRKAEQARWQARREAEQRFERRQNRRFLAVIAAKDPSLAGAPVVNLPNGVRPEQPIEAERVARYRDHLMALIESARRDTSIEDSNANGEWRTLERQLELDALYRQRPDLKAECDALCRHCQGGCCTTGAEHAHLNALTMRRQLEQDPALTDEALCERYLAQLPALTRAGSCINHTARGCALPRELRSPTCNAYYCDELKSLQAARSETATAGAALAVRRDYDHWRRHDPGPFARVLDIVRVEAGQAAELARRPADPRRNTEGG